MILHANSGKSQASLVKRCPVWRLTWSANGWAEFVEEVSWSWVFLAPQLSPSQFKKPEE